jgi:hypothetical protein
MDGIADIIFLDNKVVEAFSGKCGSPVNTATVVIVHWGGSKDIREMQILHENAEMLDLLGAVVSGNNFSLTGTLSGTLLFVSSQGDWTARAEAAVTPQRAGGLNGNGNIWLGCGRDSGILGTPAGITLARAPTMGGWVVGNKTVELGIR